MYPASRKPTTDQDTAAVLDFDCEEDFTTFFFKTRTELLETFRKATDVSVANSFQTSILTQFFMKVLIALLCRFLRT